MLDGGLRILYLYDSVALEYKPIGCLTENSLSESVSTLSTSIRSNSNGWGTVIPSRQSYSISFSGIMEVDDRGGLTIPYNDLQELKRSRTKVLWRIDSSEGADTEEGEGYITELSESASIGEAVSFEGSITGSGAISKTEWTPPSVDDLSSMIPPYEAAQA